MFVIIKVSGLEEKTFRADVDSETIDKLKKLKEEGYSEKSVFEYGLKFALESLSQSTKKS